MVGEGGTVRYIQEQTGEDGRVHGKEVVCSWLFPSVDFNRITIEEHRVSQVHVSGHPVMLLNRPKVVRRGTDSSRAVLVPDSHWLSMRALDTDRASHDICHMDAKGRVVHAGRFRGAAEVKCRTFDRIASLLPSTHNPPPTTSQWTGNRYTRSACLAKSRVPMETRATSRHSGNWWPLCWTSISTATTSTGMRCSEAAAVVVKMKEKMKEEEKKENKG